MENTTELHTPSTSNQSVKCVYISGGTISNIGLSFVKVYKNYYATFCSIHLVHPQTNESCGSSSAYTLIAYQPFNYPGFKF